MRNLIFILAILPALAGSDLIFPWVTNNPGFQAKLIVANLDSAAAVVTLTAKRADGSTAASVLELGGTQQRVLSVAEAFAELGEGDGFAVHLQSDNAHIQASCVISGTQSPSGDSPAQSEVIPAAQAAAILLFPYMPISQDVISAAVLVNPNQIVATVKFYAFQAGQRFEAAPLIIQTGFTPLASLTTNLFPDLTGDVFLVATSDVPLVGSAFIFNPLREPSMSNAIPIDRLPVPPTANLATASLILQQAQIYGHPNADAVAVADGKITRIGTTAEMIDLVGPDTRIMSLAGQFLTPGFIDNHNHLGEGGEVSCLPDRDTTLAAQATLLAQCATEVPEGEWIIGYGGAFEIELDPDLSFTTPLATLDRIFPNHPVIVMDYSSHAMFINSLGYQAMAWSADTPDPQGGVIMKDGSDGLNGILLDTAGDMVMETAVNSLGNKVDLFYQGILAGMRIANENGITTVGDGRTYWRRGMFTSWQQAEAAGSMTLRVSLRPWIYPEVAPEPQLDFLRGALQTDMQQNLIVNQVKMYSDGVPEYGTGRVIQPYTFTYLPHYPNGLNYIACDAMKAWLRQLDDLGYGAHIHAIGDLGIRETLDAIAEARAAGSQRKYHMTHLTMVDAADIARFAALNVDADFQVASTTAQDLAFYIGQQRANELKLTPIKEVADAGGNVILSSDWTVHPISPMHAIAYTQEVAALSIDEAIDAYTINAAKALGFDSLTGTISVGKSADLTVLNRDLRQATVSEIRNTEVVLTLYRGKVVFEK